MTRRIARISGVSVVCAVIALFATFHGAISAHRSAHAVLAAATIRMTVLRSEIAGFSRIDVAITANAAATSTAGLVSAGRVTATGVAVVTGLTVMHAEIARFANLLMAVAANRGDRVAGRIAIMIVPISASAAAAVTSFARLDDAIAAESSRRFASQVRWCGIRISTTADVTAKPAVFQIDVSSVFDGRNIQARKNSIETDDHLIVFVTNVARAVTNARALAYFGNFHR